MKYVIEKVVAGKWNERNEWKSIDVNNTMIISKKVKNMS